MLGGLLKKEALFGKEAVEKRLSLDLYRPFEKGIIKFSNDETGNVTKEQAEKQMARLSRLPLEIPAPPDLAQQPLRKVELWV